MSSQGNPEDSIAKRREEGGGLSLAERRSQAKAHLQKTAEEPAAERTEPFAAMADKTRGLVADPDSFILHVDQILVKPQQREDFESESIVKHIQNLAADIKANEQQQPIVVSIDPESSRFVLDAGECRLRAIRDVLKQDTIRATFARDNSPVTRLVRQINENHRREDYTPIEFARGLKQLKDATGWTDQVLGEPFNMKRPSVSKYLSLLEAPAPIQQAIHRGEIAPRDWWNDKQQVLEAYERAQGTSVETAPESNNIEAETVKAVQSQKAVNKVKNISLEQATLIGFLKKISKKLEVEPLSIGRNASPKAIKAAILEHIKRIESTL